MLTSRPKRFRLRAAFRVAVLCGLVALYGCYAVLWSADGGEETVQPALRGQPRKLAANYPEHLFSMEQIESGAIVLYFIGVIYMFIGLAVVCDEYFVPALEVITEKVGVSDDVAGATFMAAGGSAPELFTSFIGVFASESDVGFGTIVGSAVFNVLFVIGICAVFSREILTLTWWPLFRDATYYTISLVVLVVCFWDFKIELWEAFLLLGMYGGYVTLMAFNVKLFRAVSKWRGQPVQEDSSDVVAITRGGSTSSMREMPAGSINVLRVPRTFRAGVLHLLVEHVDPKGKGPITHVDKRFKRVQELVYHNVQLRNMIKDARSGRSVTPAPVSLRSPRPEAFAETSSGAGAGAGAGQASTKSPAAVVTSPVSNVDEGSEKKLAKHASEAEIIDNMEEETADVEWPADGTLREKTTYILLAPLTYALHFTIPDVRKPKWEAFYPLAFIMSILWIGFLSYFMVWWAVTIADALGIPEPVMGLTFLAAGTSIPDLLSSVIVARQGAGDMAVSSSIGSNIFDILIGLPLPWIVAILIRGTHITVYSESLVFSVMILLLMLIAVVVAIAVSGWRMTKGLGYSMFVLYAIFVAISLLIEADVISTPDI